jgi:excisionase family DNA binding protein
METTLDAQLREAQAPLRRLLRPREAAEYLGLGHSTLAKLRLSGGGPRFRKLGRCVRYHPDDLERWAAERSQRSTSETVAGR